MQILSLLSRQSLISVHSVLTTVSTAETGSDVTDIAAESGRRGVDGGRQTRRRIHLDRLLESLDVVRVLILLAYTDMYSSVLPEVPKTAN